MEQQGTWKALLREFASNPFQFAQEHWHWMIGILVLLFALSKLNNYLEVTGVNKAILVTRGFVGGVMAFLITPIAFLLLINFIAWANGLPLVNMWNIWEWFKLTGTTFWWLLECIFDFGEAPTSPVAYTSSSVIRILWIGLPILFIWWRSTNSRIGKLLFIPFIIGILILTSHRAAPPTFLDDYIPPTVFSYFKKENSKNVSTNLNLEQRQKDLFTGAGTFYDRNRKLIIFGCLSILIGGFLLGYYTEYKFYALLLTLLAIIGFYYMMNLTSKAPSGNSSTTIEVPIKPSYTELEQLYNQFEEVYENDKGKSSVTLSKISFRINQILKDKKTVPPAKFCKLYKSYFFDYCN